MTESLKVGDLVWAKMKGFSPWPGLVSNPTKDLKKPTSKKLNIHCIFFFGSNNYAWIEENNIKSYTEYKEQLMKSNKSAGFKEACEAIEKFIKDKSENPDEGPDAAFDRLRASLKLDKPADNADGADDDLDDSVGGSTSTPKQKAKKDKALKKRVSTCGPRRPKFSIARVKLMKLKKSALQGFGDAPIKSTDRDPPRSKKPSESVPKKKRRTSGNAETSTPTPKRSRKVSMDTSDDYDMDTSLMNHSQKKANASSSLLDRPSNVIRPDTPPLDVESVTQTLKEKNILPSMLKFGFLGLGIMGSGIVKNLLNSGHSVIVWNRTPAKCKDFVKAGAEECLTPSDVVQAADITFSCVADPKAAKEMVFGNCGVLLEITPNKGYVEMTGIDSETSHDIADAIQAKGGRYLEAQIQGSKTQAEEGTLVILAAGDRSLFDDCQSCFQAMGRNSFYLGEVGNASKMNLVLQLMSGVTLAGLAEGMALADRAGLQQKDVLEVLELTSLACSTMIEKSKAIIEGGFPTHLPLQHLQKDLKLSLIMGDTLEQPLPLTATANEVFKHAKRLGYGDHDASAVYIRARF